VIFSNLTSQFGIADSGFGIV